MYVVKYSKKVLEGGLFLCWQFCVCLFVTERVLNEMHKVWTFASRKALLLLCGFCFSSLENYFRLGTTNFKGKTDHSVSLRWNKSFEHFQRGEYFSDCSFDLFVSRFPEISPSFRRAELKPAFFLLVNTFSHAQFYFLCRTSFILYPYHDLAAKLQLIFCF